jgi:hypothetical protein
MRRVLSMMPVISSRESIRDMALDDAGTAAGSVGAGVDHAPRAIVTTATVATQRSVVRRVFIETPCGNTGNGNPSICAFHRGMCR